MAGLGQAAPDLRAAKDRRYKIRTGAKTATKSQQKEYLEKFRKLAEDPARILPEWVGGGASPFAKLRARLEKVQAAHAAGKGVGRAAKAKDLVGAYASVLRVLDSGSFPAFAVLPAPGRTVRFVPRGKARHHHQVAVQNHDDPEVLMLGYLEFARKGKAEFWVVDGRLVATETGGRPPDGWADTLFDLASLPREPDQGCTCRHVAAGDWGLRVALEGLAEPFTLCRRCLKDAGERVERWVPRAWMGKAREPKPTFRLVGSPYQPQNEATEAAWDEVLEAADAATSRHADDYLDYSNVEYLDWGLEKVIEALEARPDGYVLVEDRLWTHGFPEAADALAADEDEARLLRAAFSLEPPRVRARDTSLTKILGRLWAERGAELLQRAAPGLDTAAAQQLARKSPGDAARQVGAHAEASERLAAYVDFETPHPALGLAIRAARAHHAKRDGELQRLATQAADDPETKVVALAIARAGGDPSGIEWKYTPDEKQSADFVEAYARRLLDAGPEEYADAVAEIASALQAPVPRRKG